MEHDEPCVCDTPFTCLAKEHNVTDDYQCTFVDNGAECVFGKNHRVNYHHLEDGRDVQIVEEPELPTFEDGEVK